MIKKLKGEVNWFPRTLRVDKGVDDAMRKLVDDGHFSSINKAYEYAAKEMATKLNSMPSKKIQMRA